MESFDDTNFDMESSPSRWTTILVLRLIIFAQLLLIIFLSLLTSPHYL